MAFARNVSLSTCTLSSPVRVRNRYPLDPDVIAQIQQLVKRQSLLAHRIQAHINLQPLAALLQRRKPRLAHAPGSP